MAATVAVAVARLGDETRLGRNSKKPVALAMALKVAVGTGSGKGHRPLNGFRLGFASCR